MHIAGRLPSDLSAVFKATVDIEKTSYDRK